MSHQIFLLGKSNEKEGIPSYDDIFGNDDEDEVLIGFSFLLFENIFNYFGVFRIAMMVVTLRLKRKRRNMMKKMGVHSLKLRGRDLTQLKEFYAEEKRDFGMKKEKKFSLTTCSLPHIPLQ